MDDMKKQFEFLLELDKEKFIKRHTYRSDGESFENDAEHAWHMAVMAIVLSQYSNEKLDMLKVLTMILFHDVVEIEAGDTYAYDEEAGKTQAQREAAAAEKLYGLLPAWQGKGLKCLFEEFEACKTPEARFARALDNIQPLMLNAATDGRSWAENGVDVSKVLKRNEKTGLGSEALWKYAYENFIEPNVRKGHLTDNEGLMYNKE